MIELSSSNGASMRVPRLMHIARHTRVVFPLRFAAVGVLPPALCVAALHTAVLSMTALCTVSCTKISCEELSQRNVQCAEALVEETKTRIRAGRADRFAQLSEEERKTALKKQEEMFAATSKEAIELLQSDQFLRECKAGWNDPEQVPPSNKVELARCVAIKDCAAYAACFSDAARFRPLDKQ